MKKICMIVLIALLIVLSASCTVVKADSFTQITINAPEINPDYIGSYDITRTNLGTSWDEWGEWKSDFELFFDTNKCVKLGYNPEGTFYTTDGYHWVYTQTFWGQTCLELQKIDQ